MSAMIDDVTLRIILNSRGQKTIEADVMTTEGFGRASAPAGASRGKAEAVPYPEGGIEEAVKTASDLVVPELIGLSAEDQEEIDHLLRELDGTENFRRIGGNTAYAISLAVADAAADSYALPLSQYLGGSLATELPYPLGNILGGGKHVVGKAPDVQEFLALPVGAPNFLEAAEANVLVHQKVGSILKEVDPTFTGGRGDEGAWAPNVTNNQALEAVATACEDASDEMGFKIRPALDVAASSFWDEKEKRYTYVRDDLKKDPGEQLEYVLSLVKKYDLAYVEDPFHEEDFESFADLTEKVHNCLICGDDLFVTNVERLSRGIKVSAGNAVIVKVNQVGTLTDAWKTTDMAKKAGYLPVMSHRSGETTAFHIAHLAVGFRCPIIKTGVLGGERIAKLNELIRIEETLAGSARMSRLPF
ncbi:MAG: enolase [Candidatus Bathyarchaeota archaeon]|nr:enolase [Candidatus Bathyarchaeota archaeon]MDH5688175.1 enolase [Candidatus Bathyarchaeota archaeon]